MSSFHESLKTVLENIEILTQESLRIEDAVGRIAAEDVYSWLSLPPFDKSAMDGYAVNTMDTQKAPAAFKCVGLIQAGDIFDRELQKSECVKIMTGAALPENTDGVIMVEDTRQVKGDVIFLKTVKKGQNVCMKGEDLKPGVKVFCKGKEIGLSDIATLASVGARYLKTIAKPKVAVLNTGGEIIQPGMLLEKNKIYNSNGPELSALLMSDGIVPDFLGIVKDEPEELRKAVHKGLKKDILLISGGVSMGDYDLVPEILNEAGVKTIFHKTNIKPGKPLYFGKKGSTLVFGIPGNPVSTFLIYLLFVRPAIYKMCGHLNFGPEFSEKTLKQDYSSHPGKTRFVLVKVSRDKERKYVTPIDSNGSADVLALSRADGFMIVDEETSRLKTNERVRIITWKKN